MKLIILFCIVLLVSVSEQKVKFVNCSDEKPTVENEESSCTQMTCFEPGKVGGLACAPSRCRPDKIEEIIPGDLSKEYPECCDTLICL